MVDNINELEQLRHAVLYLTTGIAALNDIALHATGLHHVIGENRDGDWQAVWENVATLGDDLRAARARIAELETERDRLERGAKTLGAQVDRQCRDVLDATGLHHLIDEDGDGDWGLVWERLAEMGSGLRAARARITELEAAANA